MMKSKNRLAEEARLARATKPIMAHDAEGAASERTTRRGGDAVARRKSVVFKLSPGGTETVLYAFTGGTTELFPLPA